MMAGSKRPVSSKASNEVEFLPEELAEEERIMSERAAKVRSLDGQTLKVAIRTLPLAKAVTVTPTATIQSAVENMQKNRHGAVLVEKGGKLVGIFTERDVLMKLAGKGKDWKKEKVEDYMTSNPESLPESASLAFALNMMTEGGYRHVPIVDAKGKPLHVVSMRDVVGYICGFFEKEVKNLPPRPNLLHPTKDGG